MRVSTWLPLAASLAALVPPPATGAAAHAARGASVLLRAGTVHTVGAQGVLSPGAVLVVDGKITAVAAELEPAPGTRVVDYGPDAVLAPGLVAVNSAFGGTRAGARTAELDLRAVDGFDPYTTYWPAVSAGVTSFYLAPARGRLMSGLGAVVKGAGEDARARVLLESTGIHGTLTAEARNTPGFWEPRVPATSDVGLGVEEPQLPRTLMGAMVALEELMQLAGGKGDVERYGPYAGPLLAQLVREKAVWRMGAETAPEIRAALEFARAHSLPLVIEGGQEAGELASELAAAKVGVLVLPPIRPDSDPRDLGKGRDAVWPRYDVAARLAEHDVLFAIGTPADVSPFALRYAAVTASQGGLARERALRAITLDAARLLGVAERVGSLEAGKDGDVAVFSGPPLEAGTSVIATWTDGELSWKADAAESVVLSVDELHVGDGEVLAPAEVLIRDGRIAEVGRRVGRPFGAVVVRAPAAMPGVIDALGHLGLEGSGKNPPSRFELARIVEPGDFADRRVAREGVTTVVMSPRASSPRGVTMLAYKPAASDEERQVVDDPVAIRMQWTDRNRAQSGKAVTETLEKAREYDAKWREYEAALAAYTPPAAEPAADASAEEKDAKGESGKAADAKAEEGGESKADDKKADDKKKSKKKKDDEPPAPITGAWVAQVGGEGAEPVRLRLALEDEDGSLTGVLRCSLLAEGLVEVSGERELRKVTLSGAGERGAFTVEAEVVEPEEDDAPRKLVGKARLGESEHAFEAEQTEKEYRVARRPERRRTKEEAAPKDAPRAPNLDPDLEPLRRAMHGDAAVMVEVTRQDEILACVDTFARFGLRPVLVGATEADRVAERIADRVAGVLPTNDVVRPDRERSARMHNAYAELVAAGIPVAFHSSAEEGAAELLRIAGWAVANGLSVQAALRGLTAGAAEMLAIDDRVGRIAVGLDADVLLLDGPPLEASTRVLRVWVAGEEVR